MQLPLELDIGTSVSLISEKTWKKDFQSLLQESTSVVLKTYTGQNPRMLGGKLTVEEQGHSLPLLMVTGQEPPLFNYRNWLAFIRVVEKGGCTRMRTWMRTWTKAISKYSFAFI